MRDLFWTFLVLPKHIMMRYSLIPYLKFFELLYQFNDTVEFSHIRRLHKEVIKKLSYNTSAILHVAERK